MSKTSQPPLPPLPQKRKPLPMGKPRTTRQDWEKYINTQIRNYMKFEHKSNNPGLIEAFDLTGEMLTRRKQVMRSFFLGKRVGSPPIGYDGACCQYARPL